MKVRRGPPGGSFIPFWNLIHHFLNKEPASPRPVSVKPALDEVILVNTYVISPKFTGAIDLDNDMNLPLNVKWISQGCFQQFHLGAYRPNIYELDPPNCQKSINGLEACFKLNREQFYITPPVKLGEPYECQTDLGCLVRPSIPTILKTVDPSKVLSDYYNLDWNKLIIPSISNFVRIGDTFNFFPNITVELRKGQTATLWYKYIGWLTHGTLIIKNDFNRIVDQIEIKVLFPILIDNETADGIFGY